MGLFLCFPGFLDNDRAVTVLGSFPPNETRAPASPTLLLYIFNLSLFLTCDMKKVIYTESAFNLHGSQLYFFYIFFGLLPLFYFCTFRTFSVQGRDFWLVLLAHQRMGTFSGKPLLPTAFCVAAASYTDLSNRLLNLLTHLLPSLSCSDPS